MPLRTDSLTTWLRYLEVLHPQAIDLGLERVRVVWERLGSPRPAPVCITVGGTNGKGSTVAFLAAMLGAAGHRVGSYTSPHLLRYNERVRIGAEEVSDARLVAAFAEIEAAREEISLSYFEFGTLAAFLVLARAGLDVAVLEIGLGGRLDAVNLIDADAAILTSVDLDHKEYLGDTREQIGWDKAHIFRAGRPAILAAIDPPETVFRVAHEIGAALAVVPPVADAADGQWDCPLPDGSSLRLPAPALSAPCQRRNATAAIWAWWCLRGRLRFDPRAAAEGVAGARVRGRLERLARTVETFVDVAHNPEAARELARWLQRHPRPRSVAVFAALGDKDLGGIVMPLRARFAGWIVCDLRASSPRAVPPHQQADALRALIADPAIDIQVAESVAAGLVQADRVATATGRIVVFGSFFMVAAALEAHA